MQESRYESYTEKNMYEMKKPETDPYSQNYEAQYKENLNPSSKEMDIVIEDNEASERKPTGILNVEEENNSSLDQVQKAGEEDGFTKHLQTETFSFKTNVIYDEMTIKLEKYRFRSKLVEDLTKTFEAKDIRLNSLNIACSEKLHHAKLKCLFNTNAEAVEHYVKGFKAPELFPTFEQLQMIVDFHASNKYKLSICENSVKKFVLKRKNPMIEKQYFIQWITEVFGLNLSSILMSSISDPGCLEGQNDIVQIKLMALLCLFYDMTPEDLMKIQLFSVVYLKPNFCFKSHCGKFILVLPTSYSNYLNRLISDSKTCEMKSCSYKMNDDIVRTFCYHEKNKLFSSIE